MKIYSLSYKAYGADSKVQVNGSIYPVKIDDVVYNKDNPYYVTTRDYSSGLRGYPITVSKYATSQQVTIAQVVSGGYPNCYGFPRLIYVPDNVTVPESTLLETTTISGKYRVNSSTYPRSSPYLSDGCLDIKLSINGTYFCALCFPYFGTTWFYNHRLPNENDPGTLFLSAYREPANFLESPYGYTLLGENAILKDEYKGIWDFGSTEQIVPLVFKEWLEQFAEPIYQYTFTVKSQNGENILSSITEAPSMVDATVSAVGNVKTLAMTGVNGKTYTMTWESETQEGKRFLGLSYGANETRASIPTGRTTPVTWDGSLTIYEVYGTYRPSTTTFDINLYQNSAEVIRVDKTDYLTSIGTLSGVLREECSIIAPSITFKQTTVPTFNYVYIAAFGRYYFVTGITSVSKDIWRMSLSCDVLMTWKDNIRAFTAIISRQENSFNPLLIDSELPAQVNQNVTVTEFPAGGFSTDSAISYPFILTVVGA